MKLLTRAELTDEQYRVLRDAPHFVALAVSAAAGSFFDEIRERVAATAAIADGEKSEHPVVREIGGTDDVKAAQRDVRERVLSRDSAHRSPSDLERLAVEALSPAIEVLKAVGGPQDRLAYREFILKVARSVSGAAREGDLLGIGGEAVSGGERAVISVIEAALGPLA